MTTDFDFRALCAELVRAWDVTSDFDYNDFGNSVKSIVTRARAALADEPAVPEGREPASVTGQPSDEEIMGLMPQQMHEDLAYAARAMANEAGTDNRKAKGFMRIALNRHAVDLARAVLARWGNAAPAPPADGEVAELVEGLRLISDGMSATGHDSDSWFVARAAELLERQATACAICERERLHQSTRAADLEVERQAAPVPVPVNERLPEPEDCDAEGRCWIGYPEWTYSIADTGDTDATTPEWRLERPPLKPKGSRCYWLPAHALPPPEVGE